MIIYYWIIRVYILDDLFERSLVDISNAQIDDAQLTPTVQDMVASFNLKNSVRSQ